jgi:hypothetical protein
MIIVQVTIHANNSLVHEINVRFQTKTYKDAYIQ